jgi:hypothetical protein
MTIRHDMLVELVSDQISSMEQMLRDDEYANVHTWLHPILLRELKMDSADWNDDELQQYYCDQLGVDIPSSPPLSSDDAQDQSSFQVSFPKKVISKEAYQARLETLGNRTLPISSGMERRSLSSIYPVSNAQGMAEVAAALRSIARREENVYGLELTTEVRIPMRLLFKLVHGERSLC